MNQKSETNVGLNFQPFAYESDDKLAKEHAVVSAWVEEAVGALKAGDYDKQVNLKSTDSGRTILAVEKETAEGYVAAALQQARYWESQVNAIRRSANERNEHWNIHLLPGWEETAGRRRQAVSVIDALLRRKLPLSEELNLNLVKECNAAFPFSNHSFPLSCVVNSVERYAESNSLSDQLLEVLDEFCRKLRASPEKQISKLAVHIEKITAPRENAETELKDRLPTPQPASAGNPHVLVDLKHYMGLLADSDIDTGRTEIGLDLFPLDAKSPLAAEHSLLSEVLLERDKLKIYYSPQFDSLDTAKTVLSAATEQISRYLLAVCERHAFSLLTKKETARVDDWNSAHIFANALLPIGKKRPLLDREQRFDLFLYLAVCRQQDIAFFVELTDLITFAESAALTEGERYVLHLARSALLTNSPSGRTSELLTKLTMIIGDGLAFCLSPDEQWTEAVNAMFTKLPNEERATWSEFFSHMLTATTSRPNAKWIKNAAKLSDSLGHSVLVKHIANWFPLVSKGRSNNQVGIYGSVMRNAADTMNDENATVLRGMLWLLPLLKNGESLAREVTSVALSAYKKVPGVGPRAVKVGNAAVYCLSQLPAGVAVGQLAMLKVRVKFGTAQKEIEKAYNVAAEALGLPREEIEEMGVPTYGLDKVGFMECEFGDYRAELSVTGSNATIQWFDPKGKSLKSVPSKVKSEHKDELKELQQSLKDIDGMLPAQRDRIDSLFLLQKSWPVSVWRERYLEHLLIGTIASRLIWCVDHTPVLFVDGVATDTAGNTIEYGKNAEIELWHPVGREIDEVLAWRRRLEELRIVQPFKQAHREVYILTDAERGTSTYSNRYAAHIIRQHQFNALCAARGWKNRLRLLVDDEYEPPFKELPGWNLRAEFWVEGIGEGYGTDTNDSGVYLRLATDQVRFYRSDAASNVAHAGGGGYTTAAAGPGRENVNQPLELDSVPPLVFSEIMRDVDLFVGVASVGNDPTWQDGGPEGRYREYWNSYSFGELSGTATTRREVLQRLVPRLKIAKQCSFSDRFLVVEGSIRTYKIHLGSSNILMEPNDQYLCIVPDRKASAKSDDLFLPFEGDNTLSIIISKAFLLADDGKIKDQTILSQIRS